MSKHHRTAANRYLDDHPGARVQRRCLACGKWFWAVLDKSSSERDTCPPLPGQPVSECQTRLQGATRARRRS